MPETIHSIAKMIDHSLLHPALTDRELQEGCAEAVEFGVASACVKPCDVRQAAEYLAHALDCGHWHVVCHQEHQLVVHARGCLEIALIEPVIDRGNLLFRQAK